MLSENSRERLVTVVKRGLYYLLASFETANQKPSAEKVLSVIFDDVIDTMKTLSTSYIPLTSILSEALYQPICSERPNDSKVMMYHDHGDFTYRRRPLGDCEACHCSVLQLLFRYNLKMNAQYKNLLMDAIIFFTADHKFKEEVAVNFMQYFCFYIFQSLDQTDMDIKPVSKLIELSDQYLVVDSLAKAIIERVNMTDIFSGINEITQCFNVNGILLGNSELWSNFLLDLPKLLLMNTSSNSLFFKNDSYRKAYLELFSQRQALRSRYSFIEKEVDEKAFDILMYATECGLDLQALNINVMIEIFTGTFKLPEDSRIEIIIKVLRDLVSILNTSGKTFPTADGYFDNTLQRIFIFYMIGYLFFEKQG